MSKSQAVKDAEAKPRKVRIPAQDTAAWQRMAGDVARLYIPIFPCRVCGYPRAAGYICGRCADVPPKPRPRKEN